MAKSSSASRVAIWILMGLLILGLVGFGATNLGGTLRTVGFVGDKPLSTQMYFNAMQQEIRQIQQQTGQPLPFQRAQEIGLDQAVLQQLITRRALDNEATQIGLSIGDENVRRQVLQIGAFQGLDGQFDREAYSYALQNQGVNESEFENSLREETARNLLQSAIVGGIKMPDTFADLMVSYAGEQRNFTWSLLDASALDAPLVSAGESELRTYYDENTDQFSLPVTKRITYVLLSPDMLLDQVELDDTALRAAYTDRIDEFNKPERRLVERLVYLDAESANQAAAQLEVGGTTFEALVEERGLELSDVDMGDVGRLELDAAGEAVFSAEIGEVVGPLPSPLGQALFRLNGVLPAQSTSYEDALPQLRENLALQRAQRIIDTQAEDYNDLLAGGATLEELANETDLELGTIDWSLQSGDGIAAYDDFRRAAAQLSDTDFPEITGLDDGSIFAMRLEEELPERPEPFDSARDAVSAALERQRTVDALQAKADLLVPLLGGDADFAAQGLTATQEEGRTRGAFVPRAPVGFMTNVFEMAVGDVEIVQGNGNLAIVRLDGIEPAEASDEARALQEQLQNSLDQSLAQELFNFFANDVALRAQSRIDYSAIAAVNANFP